MKLYFEEIDSILNVNPVVWKRACNLMQANEDILAKDDEEMWLTWITLGVPDEASALDYLEIASDDELYHLQPDY